MNTSDTKNAGVRVRFAPSPTGDPHVGNVRTAIFTWLFARHNSGNFILRIEDTDQTRKISGSVERILDTLSWMGLDWDEGPDLGGPFKPYTQSERLNLYACYAEKLIETGYAYKCFCSTERLQELRNNNRKNPDFTGYDRKCRDLDNSNEKVSNQKDFVVRFAMPKEGITDFNDLIRGELSFDNRLQGDFVILKSDGFPTYHLAHIVDDYKMEISHVIRSEEWLSSVPKHIQIYRAFGWEMPDLAHLPTINAPDKTKLSKRHGATSALEFRELGYLPHSLFNFLSLLGWSLDGSTELFSVNDLVEKFSLERVSKSPAIFDIEKLNWMNGHYIRQLTDNELTDHLISYWDEHNPEFFSGKPDKQRVLKIVPLIRDRLKTLVDAAPLVTFFFKDDFSYEVSELIQSGLNDSDTQNILTLVLEKINQVNSFDSESLEIELRALAKSSGYKVGQVLGVIRVATSGLKVSPPLFGSLEILGKDRVISDMQKAKRILSKPN